MGITTGSFGGVIRDILLNEEPLFFRKDIYATACLAGGVAYWLVSLFLPNGYLPSAACAATVIGLRVLAVTYNWSLPILRVPEQDIPDDDKWSDNHH